MYFYESINLLDKERINTLFDNSSRSFLIKSISQLLPAIEIRILFYSSNLLTDRTKLYQYNSIPKYTIKYPKGLYYNEYFSLTDVHLYEICRNSVPQKNGIHVDLFHNLQSNIRIGTYKCSFMTISKCYLD